MRHLPDSTSDEHAIVQLAGRPRDPSRANERTRWNRLKSLLWPFARAGGQWSKFGASLGVEFAEAEVAIRKTTAEKTVAEAANLAADAERRRRNTAIATNREITRIMQSGLPEPAKRLQLANLLSNCPEILAQLDRIDRLYTELAEQNGLSVEMIRRELPEPKPPAISTNKKPKSRKKKQ